MPASDAQGAQGAPPAPLLRPIGRRKVTTKTVPSLTLEKELWAAGHDVVVGLDEVGRGAWAGPLAIGAAVIPVAPRIRGVRDSKLLSEADRERLHGKVAGWCRAWHVGFVSQEECDAIGMSAAQKLAARRALDGLDLSPDVILVDGNWDFVGTGNVQRLIKGDAACLTIAAASVLAKVERDRLMRRLDEEHPYWFFADNKGYPCPRHKAALRAVGPSAIHRRTWAFMDDLPFGIPRSLVGGGFADQGTLPGLSA